MEIIQTKIIHDSPQTREDVPKVNIPTTEYQMTATSNVVVENKLCLSPNQDNKSVCANNAKEQISSKNIIYPTITKETAIVDDMNVNFIESDSKSTSQKDDKLFPVSSSIPRNVNVESSSLNNSSTSLSSASSFTNLRNKEPTATKHEVAEKEVIAQPNTTPQQSFDIASNMVSRCA